MCGIPGDDAGERDKQYGDDERRWIEAALG
jgi:hypothetical protein